MAARTQTIDFLISRLEKLTDSEVDGHLSSAEKFEIMNSAMAETWDVICDAGLAEKFVKSATVSAVAGTTEYPIFTSASDFYRVHQLYVVEGNQKRLLTRLNPSEIQGYESPPVNATLKLYYIPYSPILTTGQSFDGINGWEEHSLMVACCAVKLKKEDSYSQYNQRKQELEARIKVLGNVDFGEPPRVSRKRRKDPWYVYQSAVDAYVLRGDKIELYYNAGVYV